MRRLASGCKEKDDFPCCSPFLCFGNYRSRRKVHSEVKGKRSLGRPGSSLICSVVFQGGILGTKANVRIDWSALGEFCKSGRSLNVKEDEGDTEEAFLKPGFLP